MHARFRIIRKKGDFVKKVLHLIWLKFACKYHKFRLRNSNVLLLHLLEKGDVHNAQEYVNIKWTSTRVWHHPFQNP